MIAWSVATSRFFFFNDTATTEIYTLSLHDALPICLGDARDGEADSRAQPGRRPRRRCCLERGAGRGGGGGGGGGGDGRADVCGPATGPAYLPFSACEKKAAYQGLVVADEAAVPADA